MGYKSLTQEAIPFSYSALTRALIEIKRGAKPTNLNKRQLTAYSDEVSDHQQQENEAVVIV